MKKPPISVHRNEKSNNKKKHQLGNSLKIELRRKTGAAAAK